ISYWGKIEGIANDYYILKGWDEYLGQKKFFYSTDCEEWALMPDADPQVENIVKYEQSLFTGDPSTKGKYKEEKRLSYIVRTIEEQCGLVPSGYLYLTATHEIRINEAWKGLTQAESLQMSNYLHEIYPKDPYTRRNLEVKGIKPGPKFLDDASIDKPIGAWSLQYNSIVDLVVLRSVKYPGFSLFLRPNTREWGQIYIGKGIFDIDIAFTLPAVPKEQTGPLLLEKIIAEDKEEERKKKEKEEEERKAAEAAAAEENAEEEQEA
ncbi:MAG: putative radial spoke head protein 9, partial [Streblomastix strix]